MPQLSRNASSCEIATNAPRNPATRRSRSLTFCRSRLLVGVARLIEDQEVPLQHLRQTHAHPLPAAQRGAWPVQIDTPQELLADERPLPISAQELRHCAGLRILPLAKELDRDMTPDSAGGRPQARPPESWRDKSCLRHWLPRAP